MFLFRQAAHLNNDGVSSLIEGNYVSAVHILTECIKMFQKDLEDTESLVDGQNMFVQDDDSIVFHEMHNPRTIETIVVDPTASLASTPVSPSSDEDIAFCKAFLISTETLSADSTSALVASKNLAIASVMFNLSLAHHLQASYCPCGDGATGRKRNRIKAERLYCLVLGLVDNAAHMKVSAGLLIKLAAISNIYQIKCRHTFIGMAQFEESVDRLVGLIRQVSNQSLLEEEPEINRLLMNILLLKIPAVAAAA